YEVLRVHLVLGQVFNVNLAERTEPDMERDEDHVYPLDLKTLQQLLGKVHARSGGGDSTLMTRINGLETFLVFRLDSALDIFWQGCFPQRLHHFIEGFGIAIKKEAYSSSPRCRVVDNFCNQ